MRSENRLETLVRGRGEGRAATERLAEEAKGEGLEAQVKARGGGRLEQWQSGQQLKA